MSLPMKKINFFCKLWIGQCKIFSLF